ncbi:hypothetical protein HPB49_000182 [Dermacentor silvarum]|uniref:Uncharacterized protein n=1 Tax=Dermacentor silvarum TaxID=543639 RepID=A0ACB8DHS2_DERSI|nr:hypothetical protein HPB49_000182 [Dermacentor silvarum]
MICTALQEASSATKVSHPLGVHHSGFQQGHAPRAAVSREEEALHCRRQRLTQLEGVLNCTHSCPADLSPENLSLALDRLLSPNTTVNGSTVDVLRDASHLGTVYHGLQAQLGVNHSASDEVAELLQRATLYAHSPPSHQGPQPTAAPVQPVVAKQLNSSEGNTGQNVVPAVPTKVPTNPSVCFATSKPMNQSNDQSANLSASFETSMLVPPGGDRSNCLRQSWWLP